MDIAGFVDSWAALMRTMHKYDEAGNPTAEYVRAESLAPYAISETDFPVWFFFVGPATYPVPPDQSLDRLARETRDFTARLYVGVAQEGINAEAEAKVRPYVDVARDLMQSHIRLYSGLPYDEVPGVQRAYLVRDTGVAVFPFGPPPPLYIGIGFTVRVDALNLVNYDPHQ